MDNVNFKFLSGDYYDYNGRILKYSNLVEFKGIVDELTSYLIGRITGIDDVVESVNAVREVIFSMIDVLENNDPLSTDKIIINYFKNVLVKYQELINDFDKDPDIDKIRLSFVDINNELMKIVGKQFLDVEKKDLINYLATRASSFKHDYMKLLGENRSLRDRFHILNQELKNFKNASSNKSAVDLYEEINKDFLKHEKKYRWLFITTLLTTLILTIGYDPLTGVGENLHSVGCSLNSNWFDGCATLLTPVLYPFNGDTLKYVMFKLTVLIVGVTLTTYFLRLSGFYQLKQEQAKQTKLELSAFPDFVSGMDPSVANNLRQELALKYFGKEIDKTVLEKNGDLIQEQMKAGTDLIKVSAEMVKNMKTLGISVDKTTTIKPNNTSTEG